MTINDIRPQLNLNILNLTNITCSGDRTLFDLAISDAFLPTSNKYMKLLRKSTTQLDLNGFNYIGKVTVNISINQPGYVVKHVEVTFRVYGLEDIFKAVPLVDDILMRLTNLPVVIEFKIKNNRLKCHDEKYDLIVADIYHELKSKRLLIQLKPENAQ